MILYRHKEYYLLPSEVVCSRKIVRMNYTYEAIGCIAPFFYLLSPQIRRAIYSSPVYLVFFAGVSFFGGWASNIFSRRDCMKELMLLNDSPMAMASYTIMTSDRYKNVYQKFNKRYDLDDFKERYKNFSLSRTMEPRLKGNWDSNSQDFTPQYKKILQTKSKLSPSELERMRLKHEIPRDDIFVDPDEHLYIDIKKEINQLKNELDKELQNQTE